MPTFHVTCLTFFFFLSSGSRYAVRVHEERDEFEHV